MADTSIVARQVGVLTFYDVGRGNWETPRLPRLDGGGTDALGDDERIDVVILGDGYTAELDFRDELERWIADFAAIDVYERLASAFRIRALLVPSAQPASAARDSHYRVRLKSNGTNISMDNDWWAGTSTDDQVFRRELFASVDAFDVNLRRYPDLLDVGSPDVVVGNDQAGVYRNIVVCLLVKPPVAEGISGMTRTVPRLDRVSEKVRVAFGRNRLHEFSHAFAMLSDEYINDRGDTSERSEPQIESVLTLSNVSHTEVFGEVPWSHLAPWDVVPHRQAAGSQPSPVVGWLWQGGRGHERGVWHAEYRCLMNGTHDNFAFTHVADHDPTANPDGTYTDENGARLRDDSRFCAWCREIVTVRVLERTGRLGRDDDPSDVVEQGQVWWRRWVEEIRASYQTFFAVSATVNAQEAIYAAMTPGSGREPLWLSDLFHVPLAAEAPTTGPSDLADDELFILSTPI